MLFSQENLMHLYIHIPFCKQKCSYCNFHFSTQLHSKDALISALLKELELRKNEINSPLETIYFGGGTPSILSDIELGKIFNKIEQHFDIQQDAEITLEANPDDLNAAKVESIRQLPINRFSIGVQSFFDEDLKLMNRAHSSQEAESSIKRIQDSGFENITIDLIYGSPTTTDKMWKYNLLKTIDLQIPHISSYALTVEPKTLLQHQIKTKKWNQIDDEKQENQFNTLVEILTKNGFDHYEISNFGKPHFHSKHNSAYWLGKPYVGIGPSAHSFDLQTRSWNVANNSLYIKSLEKNNISRETEILSESDRLNELTMIGLRTSYGIDLEKIKSEFSEEILMIWKENLAPLIADKHLIQQENTIYLSPKYRFFADGIAAEMFIV
ncbi:Oxygen-independent coproporphyrinogen-III oxidase [Candidatus Ornithobacterium hominis]|uniref:Heme chaperone HemW n=2 Tax=Candidatus Ornithobacterium hominis TaxID=2497989 RepID=A0A383TW67_9FLAO|nr:Oxygen-independent coproporphyrinogen-III oxidase [Candidatus Ornithobacterium hominis]